MEATESARREQAVAPSLKCRFDLRPKFILLIKLLNFRHPVTTRDMQGTSSFFAERLSLMEALPIKAIHVTREFVSARRVRSPELTEQAAAPRAAGP